MCLDELHIKNLQKTILANQRARSKALSDKWKSLRCKCNKDKVLCELEQVPCDLIEREKKPNDNI